MARAARQRAEILATIRAGDLDRARILAAEHLLEFPDDEVVRAAVCRRRTRGLNCPYALRRAGGAARIRSRSSRAIAASSIAGEKQRTLLALLALTPGEPVSADALIDELWPDAAPSAPANALQARVSAVRKVVGRRAGAVDRGGLRPRCRERTMSTRAGSSSSSKPGAGARRRRPRHRCGPARGGDRPLVG